ncbi:MAG: cytidylyltransferase domain-containing protein [Flavobacteriales bacterium]
MNLCIIQARMGSTRLPGKVLMHVGGKPILQQVLERLAPSAQINHFVVATTTNEEDNTIENFCSEQKINCYRGSDWDVLDRFYQCSTKLGAKAGDNIVRICCDNPIHSHHVVDEVMRNFLTLGVDYVSNSNHEPDFLEDGYDVEITTYSALQSAWQNATLLSEREHVMPYIKNSGLFALGWRKTNAQYNFKLSVDTTNDLLVAQTIFDELSHEPDFAIDEVVALLQRKPEILLLNKDSEINSGYKKSIEQDKRIG